MLDVSRQSTRPLRPDERALLAGLLGIPEAAVEALSRDRMVAELADGGMGSIRFLPKAGTVPSFGRCAAEAAYVDADGVTVLIAVNLDDNGDLYELDFWKTDFSPLRCYPGPAQLTAAASM